MSPVICLPDEAALRWFLGKAQVAVVYASGAITPAIFPRRLRLDIGEKAPGCDLGVAPPRALDRLGGQPFSHGDCAVFARQTLVRRVASQDCRRLRKPLLKAWVDARQIPAPGAPIPRPANRLTDALATALTLIAAEPAPTPANAPAPNPYDVLGVRPDASLLDIRRARRARMMEYHPDRVAALGARLQQVAETEARKINWAGSFLERARLS